MKNVLLIGIGGFGKIIAEKLCKLNHQVMAVDISEDAVNEVMPIVTNAQIGDSTNRDFLKTLGVANYDVCIVTIKNSFQNSLETTSLLKELGAKFVVSRAASLVHEKFLLQNGADRVVFPEKQTASWLAICYTSDHIFDYVEIDENCSIMELTIPDSWDQKTITQLDIRKKYNINIAGIRQNGKFTTTISPDTVLLKENHILVLGNYRDIQKCFKL